jgi:hypothetical protein
MRLEGPLVMVMVMPDRLCPAATGASPPNVGGRRGGGGAGEKRTGQHLG